MGVNRGEMGPIAAAIGIATVLGVVACVRVFAFLGSEKPGFSAEELIPAYLPGGGGMQAE